jgi:hypothetical protein
MLTDLHVAITRRLCLRPGPYLCQARHDRINGRNSNGHQHQCKSDHPGLSKPTDLQTIGNCEIFATSS